MNLSVQCHREVMNPVIPIISIVILTVLKMEFETWLLAMVTAICLRQFAQPLLFCEIERNFILRIHSWWC